MTRDAFEIITRHATAAQAPGSSPVIRGTPLAKTAAESDVQAVGKAGKTCKKQATQRCSTDATTCRALVPRACTNDPICTAALMACCDTCSAGGFVTCLNAAIAANA